MLPPPLFDVSNEKPVFAQIIDCPVASAFSEEPRQSSFSLLTGSPRPDAPGRLASERLGGVFTPAAFTPVGSVPTSFQSWRDVSWIFFPLPCLSFFLEEVSIRFSFCVSFSSMIVGVPVFFLVAFSKYSHLPNLMLSLVSVAITPFSGCGWPLLCGVRQYGVFMRGGFHFSSVQPVSQRFLSSREPYRTGRDFPYVFWTSVHRYPGIIFLEVS